MPLCRYFIVLLLTVLPIGTLQPHTISLSLPTIIWEREDKTEIVKREVRAAVYHAVRGQTDSNPHLTFDETRIIPHKVRNGSQKIIAVSHDLLKYFPMGSVIKVEGAGSLNGLWHVADLMHRRWRNKVDFLVPRKIKSIEPKVTIYKL